MIVRFKDISGSTFTIITPYCVGTVMGTPSIVSETLINVCSNNNNNATKLLILYNNDHLHSHGY